ncbi:uncharacterized protein LOC143469560 [Clavelina lepadiformis]|uniref:uncharacterized protein LOC143469560 n=1 Tax=Clavelina lepadiformis TaxID=159417 RepID=UPI0040420C61
MKVIMAGYSKTGTKSMFTALKRLGYNVYDFMEHFQYLEKDWEKIFAGNGTTDDFRRMYENVDAVTDLPTAYFWEELHKAFPNAKIILTMRESEDRWIESMIKQMKVLQHPLALMFYLSPTYHRMLRFMDNCGIVALGQVWSKACRPIWPHEINKMVMTMSYRRHNDYILKNAPKDKLLVFSVKQGWAPLCDFLGVEIPSEPFPHENIGGKKVVELEETHETFKRVNREVRASLLLLGLLGGCSCYFALRGKITQFWS